ncbi:MAG: PilT/PilU family type 4a pilus ATPase [Lachnospiraceae bacterium]|nr:PilT/PilU family type 4a pilus ATPase [Lachnospiraceae bacterium]
MTLEELLNTAVEKLATDVHLTSGISPRCRVNGELVELFPDKMDSAEIGRMIEYYLTDDVKERFIKNGEADFSYSLPSTGRFRVNLFRQRGNLAAAIRLFPKKIPTPNDLDIPYGVVELTRLQRGLIIVTGPTGGGKTTTLASLIDVINHTRKVHIITIEDPIEYLYHHDKAIVNQREIGIDTMSYRDALYAALREDADVILVGELDCCETVNLALMAAETGHMVFTAMHTMDCVSAIQRIIDMFPPYNQPQIRSQLGNVLNAVICRQLLSSVRGGGRVPAFELMFNNAEIKQLLQEDKIAQIPLAMKKGRAEGMQLMDDAIYNLYLRQEIDEETMKKFSGGR